MRAGIYLSGYAARKLVLAFALLAPVLLLTIAANEVRDGAHWIVAAPHRFFIAAFLRAVPHVSFPAMLLAAVWTRTGLEQRGETLLFPLLGRSRSVVATWAALPALFIALFTLFLGQEAIPRASRALRRPVEFAPEEVAKLIEFRRTTPGQGAYFLGARESIGSTLLDLRMASVEPRTVLRVEKATLRTEGRDSSHMIVELGAGDLMLPALSQTPVAQRSILFERGQLRLDPEAILGKDQGRFLSRSETTSSLLSRHAALITRVTGQTRHVSKLQHERLHRPVSSLLPFLLVWLLHWRWARRPYPALLVVDLWLVPFLMLVTSLLPLSLARHAAESSLELALSLLALAVLLPVGVTCLLPTSTERRA